MNVHELPMLFPAVLDGSCPLGVFADACDDCNLDWNGAVGERIRLLGVMKYDEKRWYVIVFELASNGQPTGQWSDAQMPPHTNKRQWADGKQEAESLMRQTAVAWVKRALGLRDVKCKECNGKGKVHRPYPCGWDQCDGCNGAGIIGKLKEEAVNV